ncbi:hypothetical protein NDU88_004276 [Pleurodeles waltl]|uniref:Uncharacterized protein n=1 Tax=Pleurodeles waltl TaxID=8319 RepID=A0AAV7NN28_PLEWA|nr:hypothetical protein NDU88_004276 [Pleurodeles waltl]
MSPPRPGVLSIKRRRAPLPTFGLGPILLVPHSRWPASAGRSPQACTWGSPRGEKWGGTARDRGAGATATVPSRPR